MSVAAVIPHVPTDARRPMLARALESVTAQTRQVDEIHVAIDTGHDGPGWTRTRALDAVAAEYVVPLDDDDQWRNDHIELLLGEIEQTNADVVFSHCEVIAGTDPFEAHFGLPWSNDEPRLFGCWFMGRTDVITKAGGWLNREQLGDRHPDWQPDLGHQGEDWGLVQRLVMMGAHIVHLPEKTYLWTHSDHVHYSGHAWQ